MSDITKIKVDGEPESSYQLYPRNEEFAKRAGGTGNSGVQPDWDQNDDTQPDYVKNRPFYTGDPVETVLLPETTITIGNSDNLISSSFPYSFEVGQTYVITFDGVDTEYTAYKFRDFVLVGDDCLSVYGGSGYFVMTNNGSIALATMDQSLYGSHTIAIKIYTQEIAKIDEKYLPIATTDTLGISKISIQSIDPKKNYTTSEIQTICDNIMSGSVIYRLSNNYIASCGGTITDTGNANFKYVNGLWFEITPTEGVWNFSSANVHYEREVLLENDTKNLILGLTYGDINSMDNLPALKCQFNTKGFVGKYIDVDSAILLTIPSRSKKYWISASNDEKLCVKKCSIGSTDAITETTLFQNGEDYLILSSSTADSNKKFKITVNDSGTLTATEVT